MKKVCLLFGIHMHQPIDNFDEAIENAVKLCYEPFFETMLRYKKFKFSLHSSGWILEKIRVKYPKVFENMKSLTKSGSIEWFTGGYYEPVLSSIPSKDRRAQIKKLSRYIEKHFGVKPRGLWLTERIWEPSLVSDLNACGIDYAMVDDYHFLSNGYNKKRMNGYYMTEDNGQKLKLFPISKSLRYSLPFTKVEDSIKAILDYSDEANSASIFFDDAEKFGLWPQTNKWVYKEKWLKNFVEAVLKNEQITSQHYGKYTQENKSLGLAYLDNCSYSEMGEWSLKTQDAHTFESLKQKVGKDYYDNKGIDIIKGGIWKNFFIKYHESNYLHKRMLYLSKKQKSFTKHSLDALYKLQTNDAFWHGVFGGFYLPSLRDNAYKYLLEIEQTRITENINFELLDINEDGYDELKVLTSDLSVLISKKHGAQLIEFGSLSALFNWQNTIMRREEAYHSKIIDINKKHNDKKNTSIVTIHNQEKEVDDSLKAQLIYDYHAKNSFIDHFSLNAFTLEDFKKLTFKELGDFTKEPFMLKNKKFIREGLICLESASYPSKLSKKYSFTRNKITLRSRFESEYQSSLYFAQEFNFHFAHHDKITFNARYIGDGFSEYNCDKLMIIDDFTKKCLTIKSNQKCNVFAFIVNTVSESEQNFEAIAQEISFIFATKFSSKFKLKFSIEVSDV